MQDDDLYRVAVSKNKIDVRDALRKDPASLLIDLARTTRAAVQPSTDDITRGPSNLEPQGRQLFWHWNLALHQLVCGADRSNKKIRDEIGNILGLNEETIASAITGIAAAYFGTPPAIAVLVGALITKLVLVPGKGQLCDRWDSYITEQRKTDIEK